MKTKKTTSKLDTGLLRYLVPIGILLAGIAFVCIGIFDGEYAVVLKKATAICLECIGIG